MSFLEKALGSKTLQDKLFKSLSDAARKKGISKLIIDISTPEIKHNIIDSEGYILTEDGNRGTLKIVGTTEHEFLLNFYTKNKTKF